jgi:DNA-binding MarR family transcriptional regulator
MPKSDATARDLLKVTMLLMRRLGARMRQGEKQRIEPAQIGILMRLSEQPLTLTELATHQVVRLPTMSKSVGLLVDRGWVSRTIPATNRRQTIVALTAEGRRVLEKMRRHAERQVTELLSALTEADRRRVQGGLEILIHELAAGESNKKEGTES